MRFMNLVNLSQSRGWLCPTDISHTLRAGPSVSVVSVNQVHITEV